MKRFTVLLSLLALTGAGVAYAQQPPAPAQNDSAAPDAPTQRPPRPADRPHRPGEALQRADANQDGKVSLKEMQALRPQMTQQYFDRLDSDGDGFLTSADRPQRRGNRDAGEAQRAFVQKLMASDADHDGKITYEELAKDKPGFPKETFSRMDRNGDGTLTLQDMQRPRGPGERPHRPEGQTGVRGERPQREGFQQRLQKADTDGDGKVSSAEARAAFPGFTDERFQRLDRNGDGFLTRADRPSRPQP